MLEGKVIVLGVTGSIACYKTAYLASHLKKQNAQVHVIMTNNATKFIAPLTFETLTGNKCYIDTFDRNFKFDVEHIEIAKKADLIMIAPASANIIAKLANGLADDMLTTTVLAATTKKIIVPAMNTNMYRNKITQDNIKKIKDYDFDVINPDFGLLACKDIGEGKMPEPELLFQHILKYLAFEKDLKGKKILVTAGATKELIDPVRYITNHSTGKMGFEIAKACMLRGADVTVIKANTTADMPMFVNYIDVNTSQEMFNEVTKIYKKFDYIIKSAAVSDYTPANFNEEKIKKTCESISIQLSKTKDILKYLGQNKLKNQVVCGFSMETENLLENSTRKLKNKNIDMIVANNIKDDGAGFGVNTNVVTIIKENEVIKLPKMTKFEVANSILNEMKNINKL